MNDKISIIVPVYNVKDYIRECIDSLIKQENINIEIILVDDCSTDGSFDICKDYEKIDKRIKLISHKDNLGVEISRNDGIDVATGEWVLFLDSDDYLKNTGLLDSVLYAEKNKLDILICSYTRYNQAGMNVQSASIQSGVYTRTAICSELLENISYPILSCVGSKLYRKAFLDQNAIRFNRYYKYNEDGAFIISALKKSNRVGYLDEPFYVYRIRSNGSYQSQYRKHEFNEISKTDELIKTVFVDNNAFTENKKALYYKKRVNLIVSDLLGELYFNSFKEFKQALIDIQSNSYFNEIYENRDYLGFKERILLFLVKHRMAKTVYILFKTLYGAKSNVRQ